MDLPVNLAAYKFIPLDDLPRRRLELRRLGQRLQLKGTILLSEEGINLFLAGSPEATERFLEELCADPAFADLDVKRSLSQRNPFHRFLVKIKAEIIAFGVQGIDPARHPGRKLAATELKRWLDEKRAVTLLDVRNDYEVKLGTFRNALPIGIDHFRDFPQAVSSLPAETRKNPLVMFCTGGIRCEKAGPYLQQAGFRDVYQLDGGILKYFEFCGGEHYEGECFVFDQRVALDADLRETDACQCYVCQAVLTVDEQQSVEYVPGVSCPFCYLTVEQQHQARITARQARLAALSSPLPGSVPYDNERPLNVPRRFDGCSLVDFLDRYHPQVGREQWLAECRAGRLRQKRLPLGEDRIVRAGESFVHLCPATVEPDVDADIRILYEDEVLVVVDKPAPLPVHACGRYNRNTLLYLLNKTYAPQRLRPAHRLDANTSGVMILSRTRAWAARLQSQFRLGRVVKEYLVKVWGNPPRDEFECNLAVSDAPTKTGARMADAEGSPASTYFRVLHREGNGVSLLQARPRTGRTNQIRVHLWSLGMPVVGDPTYLPEHRLGDAQTLSVQAPRMHLHAYRISLTHPLDGRTLRFESPADLT